MSNAGLGFRSAILWAVSMIHFVLAVSVLTLVSIFLDTRKINPLVKAFTRNILRLAGARFEVERSAGFNSKKTSFFISNHVNLFDPFVLNTAIPQCVRGLELESHFKIPVYGILMRRYGNVPVPDERRPTDLKRMWRLTQEALEKGVSLIVFPEGKRTLDGLVGPFEDGGFRMAQQLGYPVVPVSITGSFEFNRKDRWWLHPSKIVVHIHDTIETQGMKKEDVPALRERVREIVTAPVNAYYDAREREYKSSN